MKDFFISYTAHDRAWAEWVAWQLEEAGFTTLIQAWDFGGGNWVLQMDEAMRTTQRTVAILSPQYLDAVYTHAEWADKYRLDPKGEKDLLIPVRIAPVEPQGLLAQIVYVDLVGCPEEEAARDALLRRVRGERGKPSVMPAFPGSVAQVRSVTQKPPFPAAEQDQERLLRVRDIVIRWRGLYAKKLAALRAAANKAKQWRSVPPEQFDTAVAEVINLAGEAARGFMDIDRKQFEFATAYGLSIHPTVIWGQAISDVLVSQQLVSLAAQEAREALNARRAELGLPAASDPLPDQYGFEMIARVLSSAVALLEFNITRLPRGYLQAVGPSVSTDLSAMKTLLLAQLNDEPGLHLLTTEPGLQPLGAFTARRLSLSALCAQRNREHSIDLLAYDSEHVYYWTRSSPLPTMQFTLEERVEAAAFLSRDAAPRAALVESTGAVETIDADGKRDEVGRLVNGSIDKAAIWIDPLNPQRWHAIGYSHKHGLVSCERGTADARVSSEDLWSQPEFAAQFSERPFWKHPTDLTLAELAGLPCLIVSRQVAQGVGVCFLDPGTLTPLRRPLAIAEFVGEMAIASGRWLIVCALSRGEPSPRILVWDLESDSDAPIGSWHELRADIYSPIVTAQTPNSFEVLVNVRSFEKDVPQPFRLCQFSWPEAALRELGSFALLRIWQVETR